MNYKRWLLGRLLPEYMVLSAIVSLSSFPTTRRGKVIRRVLPKREIESLNQAAPRTLAEMKLCEGFEQIVGVNEVAVDDNFFDLGEHSLLASRLLNRIRKVFNFNVQL